MKENNVPGLSFTIARNDSVKIERCYGYADKGKKEWMNPGNRFRIASIGKSFTATAIMQLVERGKLHLQDRVFGKGAVLGTTYGTYPYKKWVADITVEMLLEHLSGGWADTDDPMFVHAEMNIQELISWALDNRPLRHEPGTHFQYSNFGFSVLGRVVEKVTGINYQEYVRKNILEPCGITDMQIGGNTLAEQLPGEVHYYDEHNEAYILYNGRRMDANGGWVATPTDLVKFVMRVDQLSQKADILEPATLETMFSAPAVNPRYAKGWFVKEKDTYWHGGGFPGMQSILVRTSDGFCWAAIVNTWGGKDGHLLWALYDMMWQVRQAINYWPNGETGTK
jgi:CubicO group peptidase (beta-lactamase class C family)